MINIRIAKTLVQLQLTVVTSLLYSMLASGLTRVYFSIDYGPMRAVLGLPDEVGVTYRSFADILKEGIDLTAREASETLGRNLSERPALVKRRITRISDDMNVPGVSLDDWAALIQTRQPWPAGAAAIRALSPPVTMSELISWENRVVAPAPGETAPHAFARFVDVDLPLTKLDDEVQAIEDQADREIQALIGERRGKRRARSDGCVSAARRVHTHPDRFAGCYGEQVSRRTSTRRVPSRYCQLWRINCLISMRRV